MHPAAPDTTEPDHDRSSRNDCPPGLFPAHREPGAECVEAEPCIAPAPGFGDYTGTGLWTATLCYLPGTEPRAAVAAPLPPTGTTETVGTASVGTLVLGLGVILAYVARRSSHAPS